MKNIMELYFQYKTAFQTPHNSLQKDLHEANLPEVSAISLWNHNQNMPSALV